MNKYVCILYIFIMSTYSIYGQEIDSRKELSFGFKACINYSTVFDMKTDNSNISGKTGFAGGAFLSIPLGKYVGIQPEVVLSQRGFKSSGNYKLKEYDLKRTSNYIDLPLMVFFKPLETVTILLGPQFSYLMSQTDVVTNTSMSLQQEQQFKSESYRRTVFCLTGGLDFNFNNIVFGLRLGSDLRHNKEDYLSGTPKYKNMWVQTSVGFRIY